MGSARLANGAPLRPIPLGATATQRIEGECCRNGKRSWVMPHVLSPWGCICREAGTLVSQEPSVGGVWARPGLRAAPMAARVGDCSGVSTELRGPNLGALRQGGSVLGYKTYWVGCTGFSPDEVPDVINFNVLQEFQSLGIWLHELWYLTSIC